MKIAVIYATMSGNTEAIADCIVEGLHRENYSAEIMEIPDIYKVDQLRNYDLVYLGLYTWGDGDFPDECLDMVENLQDERWDGKHFALFGSGDRSYEYFCGALDRLKEILIHRGAIVVAEPLRIEMAPDKEEEEEIARYVRGTLQEAKISKKV
ncbi:flavodoxin [Niallia sp. NCCP-28]|uniref:flavodoxin n=1 Tax=Niallia sp. NCCP-28 TaxID=2934712 RepID=UPI002081B46B|nr:flavodoxin [Niallia sp. NCCP-28]GKU84566.1 putative flavodoxin-2 [Niallia sp. NCCP-28]